MCLAIYSPANTEFVSDDVIRTAWKANPDGAGLALDAGEHVSIVKGIMELDQLLNYVNKFRTLLNQRPVLLHLRFTTSGGTRPEMTHPFPVTGCNETLKKCYVKTDKALVHNGVLFQPMTSDYSDTAIFTRWLHRFDPMKKRILQVLKDDRLAIMVPGKVQLLGDWNEDEGNFYSNHYWSYRGDPLASVADDWWNTPVCPCCHSEEVEFIGARTSATECLDCGAVFNDDLDWINPTIEDAENVEAANARSSRFNRDTVIEENEYLDDDYGNVMRFTAGGKRMRG